MPAALASGTKLAFEREGEIFVATYPNLRAAFKVGQGQDPDISFDGRFVAFEEAAKGAGRLFCIRDAATGRVIKRRDGTFPHFSPDGKRIAFSLFSGSRWTLWVSDIALNAPRKITGSGKDDPAFPSHWTANGLLIAYSEQLGGGIYALRPDGSVVRKTSIEQIAGPHDTSIPFGCAWSDDLSRIAFEATTGEELVESGQPLYGLFVYDFATRKRRQITPRGMSGGSPVWAGQDLLLFVEGRNKKNSYSQITSTTLKAKTQEMHLVVPKAGSIAVARGGIRK